MLSKSLTQRSSREKKFRELGIREIRGAVLLSLSKFMHESFIAYTVFLIFIITLSFWDVGIIFLLNYIYFD